MKCKLCRSDIDKRATLCITCSKEQSHFDAGLQTIGELKQKRGVRWRDIIRQHAARVIDNTNASCVRCGYDQHVQRAHIRDVSSFPDHTPIMVVNHPYNIMLLCPNCHWEFDNS